MEFLQFIFSSVWSFLGFSSLLILTFGFIISLVKFLKQPTESTTKQKQTKTVEAPVPDTEGIGLSQVVIGKDGIIQNAANDASKALAALQNCSGFATVTSHRKEDGSFYIEVYFSDLLEGKTLYEIGLAQVIQCLYNPDSGEE